MYRNAVYRTNKDGSSEIVLFTWDADGKPVVQFHPFKPYLLIERPNGGEYESVFHSKLKRVEFNNSYERYKWVKEHPDIDVYFGPKPTREFLFEHYSSLEKDIKFSQYPLRVFFLDIEIAVGEIFPQPELAAFPINLITLHDSQTQRYYTWALTEEPLFINRNDLDLRIFDNEKALLRDFLMFWCGNYPDVVTGWNSAAFDIPYIKNRITNVFDEEVAANLSPVKSFSKVSIRATNAKAAQYTEIDILWIDGVANIDYLFLYRDRFVRSTLYSYNLGAVGEYELGISKTKIEGAFRDFYKKDFQKFVEYNIRDVEIVKLLDDKRHLIAMMRKFCTDGLSTFDAVYGSNTAIYSAIYLNEFYDTNLLYPMKSAKVEDTEGYKGAYVKPIEASVHRGDIVCIDFNSLYPNVIATLNINPETKFGKIIEQNDTTVKIRTTKGKVINLTKEQFDIMLKDKVTLSSNGVLFLKHNLRKGGITRFIEHNYELRKKWRETATNIQNKIDEISKIDENDNRLIKLTLDLHNAELQDACIKIYLNTVYGIMGSAYSSIYDVDLAEAVTLSSVEIIKKSSILINDYFKKKFNVLNDVVIYNDTDSCYFNATAMTAGMTPNDRNKVLQEFLITLNDIVFENIVKTDFHSNVKRIEFKIESISDVAIFLSKKHYILHIINEKGKDKNEFKYTGVEMKKTEIPVLVRNMLMELVEGAIKENWSKSKALNEINNKWEIFQKLIPEEMSYFRGLSKTRGEDNFLQAEKGSGIHAKSAMYYNQLLDTFNIGNKYEKIKSGDKMRYVYITPDNPYNISSIGFLTEFPEEFKQILLIDFRTMFQKMVIKPIASIFKLLDCDVASFDNIEQVTDISSI